MILIIATHEDDNRPNEVLGVLLFIFFSSILQYFLLGKEIYKSFAAGRFTFDS